MRDLTQGKVTERSDKFDRTLAVLLSVEPASGVAMRKADGKRELTEQFVGQHSAKKGNFSAAVR